MIFKIVDWPQIVEAVWRICSPPRATTICKTQWHLESNFFHLPRVWVATPAYQYSGNEFELFSTGSINLWYWTESSEYATELRWQQLPLIPQPAGRPSIFYASWRLDIDKLLYPADSSEHTSDWRPVSGKRPSDSRRLTHPPDFIYTRYFTRVHQPGAW